MDLYGQEPEIRLLTAFLGRLQQRAVIDVGAERGAFAEAMLEAGSGEVHVIEPEPGNASFLRERFKDDARVVVHECAIGDSDGEVVLHRSVDPSSGRPVTFGHTVLARPDSSEIAWRDTVTVTARSIGSLVAAGELPARAGIVKVDTEGNDLRVVAGLGSLDCDVVIVEHWQELPNSLGPCPWAPDEMISALEARGFPHFAFVMHHRGSCIVKWDDADVASGDWGNLVFLNERVGERLLPDVLETASAAASDTLERLRRATEELLARQEVIEGLQAALQESEADREARLEVIEKLDAARIANEADRKASLELIGRLEAAHAESIADGEAKRRAIEQLEGSIERLGGELTQERDERNRGAEELARLRPRDELLRQIERDRLWRLRRRRSPR